MPGPAPRWRLRRDFESESRRLLAQLEAALVAPSLDDQAMAALRRDVAWLRGSVVRHGSQPAPHLSPRSAAAQE